MRKSGTDHAGAGEDIPAQTNAITVLDLAPLLLEGFVIHVDVDGVLGRWSQSGLARNSWRRVMVVSAVCWIRRLRELMWMIRRLRGGSSRDRYGAGGGQRATSSGGYVQGVISSETWNARDTRDIHRPPHSPQQLSCGRRDLRLDVEARGKSGLRASTYRGGRQ